MILVAFHSYRARSRASALLAKDLDYAQEWRRGPRAGFAEVSDAEFARIRHLSGVTHAKAPHKTRAQLPLLY